MIEDILTEIDALVPKLIRRLQKGFKNLSRSEQINLIADLDTLEEMRGLGLSKKLNAFLNEYRGAITEANLLAKGVGIAALTGSKLQVLNTIAELDFNSVLGKAEAFANLFKTTLLKGIVSGESFTKITDRLLEQKIGLTDYQTRVALNQAYNQFNNTAKAEAFKGTDERWILDHPNDEKTRDICQAAIGLMGQYPEGLTVDEINEGALGSEYSFIDGGGFNCRFYWELVEK